MLDFTRLMLISTQVEVVVEVGVELGKSASQIESERIHALSAGYGLAI